MALVSAIQIAKTTSGPADRRAPSFLTTLPPEVRNTIYEFLFKREAPILLHDSSALVAVLNRQKTTRTTPVKDEEFHHGLGHYTPLLLSCRQIYHEAAGVLYTGNTFLFSRVLNLHNEYKYDQTRFAGKWLSRLGSQTALLSSVQIDADALCPSTCNYCEFGAEKDLLPLLRVLWNHPRPVSVISFVHSGRHLDRRLHHDLVLGVEVTTSVPVDMANNLLATLGKQDALNIKRYSKYKRLMSKVTFGGFYDRRRGVFVGGIATPPRHHKFDVLENGTVVRVQTSSGSPLEQINISLPVFRYVCPPGNEIIFDLDLKTARGLELGYLGVNRYLRSCLISRSLWRENRLILTMATNAAVTSFDNFRALQHWRQVHLWFNLPLESHHTYSQHPEIRLNFKLPAAWPLNELRIDIGVLLRVFVHLDRRCTLIVTQSGITPGAIGLEGKTSITWAALCLSVFLLLSCVIGAFPSESDKPLPQIWIDGTGRVLRATYPATDLWSGASMEYLYSDLTEEDQEQLFDKYAEKLLPPPPASQRQWSPVNGPPEQIIRHRDDCLLYVWKALRTAHEKEQKRADMKSRYLG